MIQSKEKTIKLLILRQPVLNWYDLTIVTLLHTMMKLTTSYKELLKSCYCTISCQSRWEQQEDIEDILRYCQ